MSRFIQLTFIDTDDSTQSKKFKPVEVDTVEDMQTLFKVYVDRLSDEIPVKVTGQVEVDFDVDMERNDTRIKRLSNHWQQDMSEIFD